MHPSIVMTFTRILIATDFSPSSEAAWRLAASLATVYRADLVLLHVVALLAYDVVYANTAAAEEEERQRCLRLLDERARAAAAEGLHVRTVVRTGRPGETIADCARDEGVDLVVVGTHGRHGLNRLLLGSVAERVVRLAPCHVLTVRAVD
jgi:nucleotide-binding universal stress UspA family protein